MTSTSKSITVIAGIFFIFVGVMGAMVKGFEDGKLHQPANFVIAEGPASNLKY